MIDITTKGYIEVFRNGVRVSRHTQETEAIESAGRNGPGEYTFKYPDKIVRVIGTLVVSGDTTAPSQPDGLTATAINRQRVDLTWVASTDNVGVTGYNVYRDGSLIGSSATTSYSDTTAQPATTYSYTVAAFDAAGNSSEQSDADEATTPANSTPSWSSIPAQTLIVGNSYSLNLNNYCTDSDGDTIQYSIQSGTLPSGLTLSGFTISGVPTTAGQTTTVTVRASDTFGFVDTTIAFATYNADVTAPPVPGAPTLTAGPDYINLAWTAVTDTGPANEVVSGTQDYRVYRSVSGGAYSLRTTTANVSYSDTGLAASTEYSYRLASRDVALNESSQGTSSSITTQGQSGTYTATHYVAPFAQVSGAANDYAVRTQAEFNAATSPSTPTTLGNAMRWAEAGHRVRVAPGVYIGQSRDGQSNWFSAFAPTNSGTVSNPIIFFAQHTAATNYGSTALYSELRSSVTISISTPRSSVLGTHAIADQGVDHTIFDGFYFNEAQSPAGPTGGIARISGGSVGCKLRRCVFDRSASVSYINGYNGNCLYMESTIDTEVFDCRFHGTATSQGNVHNDSSLEVYNSANYLISHCTFDGATVGLYPKENDAGGIYTTTGAITYCLFYDCRRPLEIQQGATTEVAHCLMYGLTGSLDWNLLLDAGPDRPGTLDFNIHHNTIVVSGANTGFGLEPNCDIATSEFRNNIIYATSTHSRQFIACEGTATNWAWSDWTLSNNCYYAVNGTRNFRNTNNAIVSGLTNWQAATGGEAQSITSDPQFVNVAANNYRLANNGQQALTASTTGGPIGCYITGSEEIGVRASPTY